MEETSEKKEQAVFAKMLMSPASVWPQPSNYILNSELTVNPFMAWNRLWPQSIGNRLLSSDLDATPGFCKV